MEKVSYMEFRQHFSDYLGKTKFARERFIITQRGKPAAVLVSLEDLETIRSLENSRDIEIHEKAAKEGSFVDWSDVRRKLIKKHKFTANELQGQD